MLFDGAFTYGASPDVIIHHELAHQFDMRNATAQNKKNLYHLKSGFLGVSGWQTQNVESKDEAGVTHVDQSYKIADPAKRFVTTYAKGAPIEDFAEAVSYYINEPQWLKYLDPAKYEFVRVKAFGGREYIQTSASKTLDALIDQAGGLGELAAQCIESLTKIGFVTYPVGYSEATFAQGKSSEPLRRFLSLNSCADQIAGDQVKVREYIRSKIQPWIVPALTEVNEFVLAPDFKPGQTSLFALAAHLRSTLSSLEGLSKEQADRMTFKLIQLVESL